jgi:hypothetical protein
MTVEQLYEQAIKPLSADDRLRLATFIVAEFPQITLVDKRDDWSEEDWRDVTAASLRYFETAYPDFPSDTRD